MRKMVAGLTVGAAWCVLAFVSGAAAEGTKKKAASPEDFGISAASKMNPVSPDQWYFRVVIEPKLDQATLDRVDQNTNNRWRRLGFKDVRGYTVSPALVLQTGGGTAVATVAPEPILAIGVDTSQTGNSAKLPFSSRSIRNFSTAWTLLGANQQLMLQLAEAAQNDNEWQGIQRNLGKVTEVVRPFTPVTVPIGAPAALDGLINVFVGSAAPGVRASSTPIRLDPLGTGEYAYNIEFRDITAPTKAVFGSAQVRVEFRRSMGATKVWTAGLAGEPTDAVSTATPISQLRLVTPSNPEATLAAQSDWLAIQNAAQAVPVNKSNFASACNSFRDAARSKAGMTRLDANISLLEALEGTSWRRKPQLVTGTCFSKDDRTILTAAGHPVPDPITDDLENGGALAWSQADLQTFGAYLRRGARPDVRFEQAQYDVLVRDRIATQLTFDPSVPALDNLAYTVLPALEALTDLQAIKVDRFCCVAAVTKEDADTGLTAPNPARRRLLVLLPPRAPDNAPLFLETELATTTDSGSKLGRVSLRPADAERSTYGKKRICTSSDEPAPAYLGC